MMGYSLGYRGAWWAAVHGISELDTTEHLSRAKYVHKHIYLLEV